MPPVPPTRQLTPVVAVVVHYRGADDTLACVASLRRQQPAPRIVVVDNASPDGSLATLLGALGNLDDVTVLCSGHNGGFGAGCNLGIGEALRRLPDLGHVLLLNPDATLAPGALAALLDTAARHPRAGIVGCRIDAPDGRPWFENGRFAGWTLSRFHRPAPPADEYPTTFVTGACMLLAGDLLREGLRFDEDYFLYCEDVDLCREVSARGRELWITSRARATHRGGGSQPGEPVLDELSGERLRWLTRAKVLLAKKRLPAFRRAVFWLVAVLVKPPLGVLRSGSLRFLRPYFEGLFGEPPAPGKRFERIRGA